MQKKRLLYIVNPISGNGRKASVVRSIERRTDADRFCFEVRRTEYAGHAAELARQAVLDGVDIVAAVGGDGTINEVARSLVGTPTALAIVPCGSGNGLARHLQIPLNAAEAIGIINRDTVHCLDYGLIDERPFFCTCGVGFDAAISQRFAESGRRGPITYVENVLRESLTYKPEVYTIENLDAFPANGESALADGKTSVSAATEGATYQAFLIACANASQYGNNAYIAPQASMKDGLMDIVIMEPFSAFEAPQLAVQLFRKTLPDNSHIRMLQSGHIRITRRHPGTAHCDGDPFETGSSIDVRLVHRQFNVVVNPDAHTHRRNIFQLFMEDADEWWLQQQRTLRRSQVGLRRLNRDLLNRLRNI